MGKIKEYILGKNFFGVSFLGENCLNEIEECVDEHKYLSLDELLLQLEQRSKEKYVLAGASEINWFVPAVRVKATNGLKTIDTWFQVIVPAPDPDKRSNHFQVTICPRDVVIERCDASSKNLIGLRVSYETEIVLLEKL